MVHDSLNKALDNVYRLNASCELIEASMLAEEILTDAHQQWQAEQNEGGACELVAATCAYATVLRSMERQREAYAACLTALAYTARIPAEPAGMLSLCLITWKILEQVLNSTEPTENGEARGQIAVIDSSLGSLLYYYYYLTGHSDPDHAVMQDAYSALRVLNELVAITPDVSDTLPFIRNILSSSERIGLIQ
jgi:hypothetical protein